MVAGLGWVNQRLPTPARPALTGAELQRGPWGTELLCPCVPGTQASTGEELAAQKSNQTGRPSLVYHRLMLISLSCSQHKDGVTDVEDQDGLQGKARQELGLGRQSFRCPAEHRGGRGRNQDTRYKSSLPARSPKHCRGQGSVAGHSQGKEEVVVSQGPCDAAKRMPGNLLL